METGNIVLTAALVITFGTVAGIIIHEQTHAPEIAEANRLATLQQEQNYDAALKITPGMEDCKFHFIEANDRWISAIRCPNSTVTVKSGSIKAPQTTITEDR